MKTLNLPPVDSRRSPTVWCWLIFAMAVPAGIPFDSQPAMAQQNVITVQQFDAWIFSQMRDESNARALLKSRIELEIERLDRVASLTDPQRAKIRLAGTGDVERFFDQVRKARQAFAELGLVQQNNINEAYQLASPLAQRLGAGLFGEESLLKKVALAVRDPEQAEAIREHEQLRLKRRKNLAIRSQVAMLGRSIPLTADQRKQLSDLISESVEVTNCPPAFYGTLIFYRLSEVPKDRLSEFLDDRQIGALETRFRQAANARAALLQLGVIDE